MQRISTKRGIDILVDDADYPYLSQFHWMIVTSPRNRYAVRHVKTPDGRDTNRYMHREILGLTGRTPFVDHIDHNGLNNQRSNLRTADYRLNGANRRKNAGKYSSKYKGVFYHKKYGYWQAQIQHKRNLTYLGWYKTEEAAAEAYNREARLRFGEFACLNEIPHSAVTQTLSNQPGPAEETTTIC